ncbi:hypothetical protein N7535_006635 [Penicillium sp. DV-2018c]|nr:hypothetical protein N7535_006635 [Penicillium sp. DV-2018c]
MVGRARTARLPQPKIPSTNELEILSFGDLERDPQELIAAGFRPVWSFSDGYPGPLPADCPTPQNGSIPS